MGKGAAVTQKQLRDVMTRYFEDRAREFKNQSHMAKVTGIKHSHISNVLSGSRMVSWGMLVRIATTVGPELSEILHSLSIRCHDTERDADG